MRKLFLITLLLFAGLVFWLGNREEPPISRGLKISPTPAASQPHSPLISPTIVATPKTEQKAPAPSEPALTPTVKPLEWFDMPDDFSKWSDEAKQTLYEMDILFGQADEFDKSNNYASAEKCYEAILTLWKDLPHQDHHETKSMLGIVHNNLAVELMEQDKFAEAESNYRKALEIHRGLSGEFHKTVAKDLNNLGALQEYQKKYAEAEALYRQSLEIRERLFGRDDYELAVAHANIGQVSELQNHFAEAEKHFLRCLEIRKRTLGNEHRETREAATDLTQLYKRLGRHEEAAEVWKSLGDR